MESRAIIPMIDLVFLTLGGILGVMTQMEIVTALPVDITRVGHGASVVQRGDFAILALGPEGMMLDGKPVAPKDLETAVAGREVVLRADEGLPTRDTLTVMADLVRMGVNVSLEVKDQPAEGR